MKTIARLSACLALALFAGCSSFHEKWSAAGQPGKFQNASRWEGRWVSAHHKTPAGTPEGGRLRCVIEPLNDARILAHFHANWLAFSADYSVPFDAKIPRTGKRGAPVEFRGTHELPKMFGGVYRYDARISAERFTAQYGSSYDAGIFEMTRLLTTPAHFH